MADAEHSDESDPASYPDAHSKVVAAVASMPAPVTLSMTNPFSVAYMEHMCKHWDNATFAKFREVDVDLQDRPKPARGRRFVMSEKNALRRTWHLVLCILLLYTGTFFPYRLAFLEFGMPAEKSTYKAWDDLEAVVDILFWVDLCVYFFFSTRDKDGAEVFDVPCVAIAYLQSHFIINLLACFPVDVFADVNSDKSSGGMGVNSAVKLGRLQRISRLSRIIRLGKLANVKKRINESYMMGWIFSLRGVRVLNFCLVLLAVVHLLGCGWFLVASFHEDQEETWVGRRGILYGVPASEQWATSCYFVLTVFSSVGFGDISAVTVPEIVYACVAMIIGAVVQSLIVSEMIGIVKSVDKVQEQRRRKKELIQDFGVHTEITRKDARMVLDSIPDSVMKMDYQKEDMRRLIIDGTIPRHQVLRLSQSVYQGELIVNRFLTICIDHRRTLPPRLPLLLALAVESRTFCAGEFAYHAYEHAWSVFIVLKGTMAAVGVPQPQGGIGRLMPGQSTFFSASTGQPDSAKKKGKGEMHKLFLPTADANAERLFPYQFYSFGNYFGEAEVINMVPRGTAMRCESPKARVLICPKDEFFRLAEEFPGFAGAWRAAARRREDRRHALLKRLKRGLPYRELAAAIIQNQWRRSHIGKTGGILNYATAAMRAANAGQVVHTLSLSPSQRGNSDEDIFKRAHDMDRPPSPSRVASNNSYGPPTSSVASAEALGESARSRASHHHRRHNTGSKTDRVTGYWTSASVKNTVHQLMAETDKLRGEVRDMQDEVKSGFSGLRATLDRIEERLQILKL